MRQILDLQILSHQEYSSEEWDEIAREEYWSILTSTTLVMCLNHFYTNDWGCTRLRDHKGPCRKVGLGSKQRGDHLVFDIQVKQRA
jgi:hypothetical protein